MGCIKLSYLAEKNSTLKVVHGGRFVGGNSGLDAYRYGFNGKEKDTDGEWGTQTHYDYGFRIYNPGIGKFLSVDPLTKKYPELTPYQFASNTPIMAVDLDGLEAGMYKPPSSQPKYKPVRDVADDVVIISSTSGALTHYERGKGEIVRLSDDLKNQIVFSEDMEYYRKRIIEGKTSSPADGIVPVNMEPESWSAYHIGRIPIEYNTICNGDECTTTFTVEGDGFWDPIIDWDGDGPAGEFGDPYDYESFHWDETYQNPGFPVGENGIPSQNKDTVEPGEGAPNSGRYRSRL